MTRDRAGRTDLHYAALEGRLADLRTALSAGEDPSAPDDAGFTPLHFAAQQGMAQAVEALLSAGADVEATNRYGNTPLWVGVMNMRTGDGPGVVRHLLQAGSSLDSPNNAGVTVREVAERMGIDLAELRG